MTDNYIQHQPDSTGKRVETEERVNYDGVTVHRQIATLPDPVMVDGDPLDAILVELKLISYLLATGLNVNDSLESLRRDFYKEL